MWGCALQTISIYSSVIRTRQLASGSNLTVSRCGAFNVASPLDLDKSEIPSSLAERSLRRNLYRIQNADWFHTTKQAQTISEEILLSQMISRAKKATISALHNIGEIRLNGLPKRG